jgi:hypothetical protein
MLISELNSADIFLLAEFFIETFALKTSALPAMAYSSVFSYSSLEFSPPLLNSLKNLDMF